MRTTILSLIVCAAVAANAQELTITSRATRNGEKPETTMSYITPERFRMSQPRGQDVIFDFKSGDMTVIDHQKKTWWVMTQKDIDDMAALVNERMNSPEMKQAQEQMKNLPPDMQKRMQSMMGGAMQTDVHKTGETRTIAGLKCDVWSVNIGQMSHSEQCVTTELKLPVQAWERYKKFNDSMKSMMAAMGPMSSGIEKMREEMAKMKGFPIASTTTTTIMGHTSVDTSEVTDVSHGPVPASAWSIPAGYKQVENPMKADMARARQRGR